jgi:amino acid adenylation domain-containing protein
MPSLPVDRAPPTPRTDRAWRETGGVVVPAFGGDRAGGLLPASIAALAALLHRGNGQERIELAVELPRGHAPAAVGRLALCLQLSARQSFGQLVEQVHDALREAAHAGPPAHEAVSAQDAIRQPPSRVVLHWRAGSPRSSGGHPPGPDAVADARTHDLVLEAGPEGGGRLGLALHASADLFEAQSARRMLAQLRALLVDAARRPERPLAQLSLAGRGERRSVLAASCGPPPAAGGERAFVHEHIASQARRTPDAVAVAEVDACLSYRELDCRANRLANQLCRRGVAPESVVGLFLPRSADLVVAMLAVLKAGAAFLPLDPDYPSSWLRYMIDDSAAPLIVSRHDVRQRLPRGTAEVLTLAWDRTAVARAHEHAPAVALRPGNPAYVFYTSGSTGRPKGVVWPHARVIDTDPVMQRTYGFGPADRHLLKSAAGFTLLVREVLWPLRSGATLFVVPADDPQDPASLAGWIARQRITIVSLVPSMLSRLLDEPAFLGAAALRHVVCFGEALGAELRQRFHERHRARLSVFYGATEAPSATFIEHRAHDRRPGVLVGRPLPRREVYVLDPGLEPVPPGVAGEIWVGGNLSRGYLRRPGLTAERFAPHPFSPRPGARLYRTGDRARWRADGILEFLGRADEQINVRGVRIELAEVEGALAGHPELSEAAAGVCTDAKGEQVLLGFVVPRHRPAPSAQALREFLGERLPSYMVPAAFDVLESLPRTPSGKLDRRALPDLAPAQRNARGAPPGTSTERALAELWCRLLDCDRVDREDDFFELGGNSIAAARLVARLRDTLDIEIPLRLVFDFPTLGRLAGAVDQALASGGFAPSIDWAGTNGG